MHYDVKNILLSNHGASLEDMITYHSTPKFLGMVLRRGKNVTEVIRYIVDPKDSSKLTLFEPDDMSVDEKNNLILHLVKGISHIPAFYICEYMRINQEKINSQLQWISGRNSLLAGLLIEQMRGEVELVFAENGTCIKTVSVEDPKIVYIEDILEAISYTIYFGDQLKVSDIAPFEEKQKEELVDFLPPEVTLTEVKEE